MSELPPGFVLDSAPAAPAPQPSAEGLPEGFVLDAPAAKPKPYSGAIFPFTRDENGNVSFDSNAGILGSIKRAVTLPRDAYYGNVDVPSDPRQVPDATMGRILESTLTTGVMSPLRFGTGAAMPVPASTRIGVDMPVGIASESPITRFTGQVVARAPGGGPMADAVANAVRQTGEAVGRASEMTGGAADAASAGAGFRSSIDTYFKPAVKAKVGAAYDEVQKFVNPEAVSPLTSTKAAVDDIVARRLASGESDPGKAVKTVFGGVDRGELTFQGLKDLRTRVGEMLDTGVFPEGMSQGELRRIYGSLSDDLKNAAFRTGGEQGLRAFENANAVNSFMENWKDSLGKVLGADRSGEGINAALLRAASSGPMGDVKALAMARAAVPKEVWQDVAATAVSGLGKARNGEWSPAKFISDYASLSERGKALLFGSVGSRDVLPFLDDIAKVSQNFVRAGKLANTSGTAGHAATYTMMGSAATGLLHGSLVEPMTAAGTIVGINLLSRALARKETAASLARWTRAYDSVGFKPSPASMATYQIASRNLANTLNSSLGAKIDAASFMKAFEIPKPAGADDQ